MRFLTYLLCTPLLAQPVLLPGGFAAPSPFNIQTPAGAVAATLSRVAVNRTSVTVVVLGDTLSQDKFEALRKTLLLLYPLLPKSTEFSLALLRGEQIQRAGPFQDRAALQDALTELAGMIPEEPAKVDAAKLYTVLAKSARQFAGNWPTVMVAGVYPEGNFGGYLPTYLERAFSTAKVRVNFLTYGGAPPSLPGAAVFYDDARELAEFLKDAPEEWQELKPSCWR